MESVDNGGVKAKVAHRGAPRSYFFPQEGTDRYRGHGKDRKDGGIF